MNWMIMGLRDKIKTAGQSLKLWLSAWWGGPKLFSRTTSELRWRKRTALIFRTSGLSVRRSKKTRIIFAHISNRWGKNIGLLYESSISRKRAVGGILKERAKALGSYPVTRETQQFKRKSLRSSWIHWRVFSIIEIWRIYRFLREPSQTGKRTARESSLAWRIWPIRNQIQKYCSPPQPFRISWSSRAAISGTYSTTTVWGSVRKWGKSRRNDARWG